MKREFKDELTIKELADFWGVTKQAMQYRVKKLPKGCTNFVDKNGKKVIVVNREGQEILLSQYEKRHVENMAKTMTSEDYLNIMHQLELKELENKGNMEKLAILQKKCDEQSEHISSLMELLDHAQQLQAAAEQRIALLEEKKKEEAPAEPIIVEPTPEPATPDPFEGLSEEEIYDLAKAKLPRITIFDRFSDKRMEEIRKQRKIILSNMTDREREVLDKFEYDGDGK